MPGNRGREAVPRKDVSEGTTSSQKAGPLPPRTDADATLVWGLGVGGQKPCISWSPGPLAAASFLEPSVYAHNPCLPTSGHLRPAAQPCPQLLVLQRE